MNHRKITYFLLAVLALFAGANQKFRDYVSELSMPLKVCFWLAVCVFLILIITRVFGLI